MIKIAMPQMGTDLFRKYMKSKYVKSLADAGAQVVWIELDDAETAVKKAVACDGLLLPGGADIEPSLYGEERDEKCGKPNEIRDAFEPLILDAFLKTGKPILGICRGIQVLNVYCKGSLYQDIKGNQTAKHSDFLHRASHTHEVNIEENSKLFEILQKSSLQVNSIHHQAIKTLGEGLRATAESSDGFTEAVELENYGFCVAVQWHPEHMAKRDENQRKIFKAFVKACEEYNG